MRDLIAQGGSRGAVADLGARFGLVTPVSGLALGPVAAATGVFARSSLWDEDAARTSLPSLGVADGVAPRGIASQEHNASRVWPHAATKHYANTPGWKLYTHAGRTERYPRPRPPPPAVLRCDSH